MFFPEERIRIFYYPEPVDMRKSFNGLYAIVKHQLNQDPLSGHLFVFCNKSKDYIKSIYWDRTGFCLWAKKLERGRFNFLDKKELSYTDFKMVLEGIEIKSRKKRFNLQR